MASVNQFFGVGNLVTDPKLKHIPSGDAVCEMRIAFNRPKGPNGEDRGADFLVVETWGASAEACHEHLTKGRQVAIQGHVRQNAWQDETENWHERILIGNARVTFLGGGKSDDAPSADREPVPAGAGDDDIPF